MPREVKCPAHTASVSEKCCCVLIGALAVDSRPQTSGLLVGCQRRARTGQFRSVDGGPEIVDNRHTRARHIVLTDLLAILKMTVEELRSNLLHLVETYVTDSEVRDELHSLVNRRDVPAKGVLAQLTPFMSGRVSESDAKIIGEIAFYFC